MPKKPDPEVQFRVIKEAWERLDDDGRLQIVDELFGPIQSAPAPAFQHPPAGPSEVHNNQDHGQTMAPQAAIQVLFQQLVFSEQLRALGNLFNLVVREVDLSADVAGPVLAAGDEVYKMLEALKGQPQPVGPEAA